MPFTPSTPLKLAVLASGKGSNLRRIAEACRTGHIPGEIVLVFTDQPQAGALAIADEYGIPSRVLQPKDFPDRGSFDQATADVIEQSGAELLVFAGYMRLVSYGFIARFQDRMINVHPSLLPAFKGAHAVRDALEYGVKVVGVTVHFVTEDMDAGPIILQDTLAVHQDDTVDSLLERVHEVEHRIYPEAVRLFAEGKLSVEGGKVRIGKE